MPRPILSKNPRMAAVRGSGNKSTELRLLTLMTRNGIQGWRRNQGRVFGKPDFVFYAEQVAVFVDGSFWHGHPSYFQAPRTNTMFWVRKIAANKIRDKVVTSKLRAMGWKVLRIWEHNLRDNPRREIRRLKKLLNAAEGCGKLWR